MKTRLDPTFASPLPVAATAERAAKPAAAAPVAPALTDGPQEQRPPARILGLLPQRATQRFASLDLGSSSVKLLIEERDQLGNMHVLADSKIGCQLGKNVPANGAIPDENIARAMTALQQLLVECQKYGVQPADIPMVTTAVVRNSTNGADFAQRVRSELGLQRLKVLTGTEEAAIGYAGALEMMHGKPDNYATLDLGGGSFQLAIGTEKGMDNGGSTQIGSNYVCEKLLSNELLTAADFAAADTALKTAAPMPLDPTLLAGRTLIGVGGVSKFLKAHFGNELIKRSDIDALRLQIGQIPFDQRVAFVRGTKNADTLKALGLDTDAGARDYGIKLVGSTTLLLHIFSGIGVDAVRVSESDARFLLIDQRMEEADSA